MFSVKLSQSVYYILLAALILSLLNMIYAFASFNGDKSNIDVKYVDEMSAPPPVQPVNTQVLVNTIASNPLFGQYRVPQAPVVRVKPTMVPVVKKVAPIKDTKLDIKLLGLVNGDTNIAVIAYLRKQATYSVDDYIVKSSALTVQLSAIFKDHIVINHNGTKERLKLPELNQQGQFIKKLSMVKAADDASVINLKDKKYAAFLGREPQRQLASNPMAFNKYLQLSAQILHGTLTGYQLKIGQDNRLAIALSVQNGDVVTHFNGKNIADLTSLAVIGEMAKKEKMTVTINRKGQPIIMSFRL